MKRSLAVIAALCFLAGPSVATDIGTPEICKAAIGVVMGRDPAMMKIDRSAAGIEYLSYVRDDGTLWSYRCRLEGSQVIWSTDKGRWHDQADDGTIIYKLAPDRSNVTVTETYTDGSASAKEFPSSAF